MSYSNYKETPIIWNDKYPSHWVCEKAKRFFRNPKLLNKNNNENNVLSLTLKGIIRNNKEKPIGLSPEDYSTYQVVNANELIFKLIDLNNISTSRVGIAPETGIMSSAYIRFVPKIDLNIKYFYYQYFDWYKRNIFNGLGDGVRQTLSGKELGNLEIYFPPREEQDQIVRYLDWQVSKINKLINSKKKEIELLNSLKKSVVDEVVIHGLNHDVSMKFSGVKWVGNIPKHWSIIKLRQILRPFSEKNHPELPLLSVVREQGVIIRDVDDKESNHNFIPEDLTGYKLVKEGQFAMNKMKAWQGSYGISKYTGIVSPAYFVFDVNFDNLEYFHYAIRSKVYVNFFAQASDGIRVGQWDLSMNKMKEVPFIVPPLEEQEAIVRHIPKACEEYNIAIDKLNKGIELLYEYRSRLISDVVTGQVDVRGIEIPEYEFVEDCTTEEDDVDDEANFTEVEDAD